MLTRRTITPMLWSFLLTMPVIVIWVLAIASLKIQPNDVKLQTFFLTSSAGICGAKIGTDKAREYGRKRLEQG
jgi:hypothetical protein